MPVFRKFRQANLKFGLQQVAGSVGAVPEHVFHAKHERFSVHDHTGIRRDRHFTFGESVQGIYCLVGRDIIGQVDQDLHFFGCIVVNFADLDLAFVVGCNDRAYQTFGGLTVGDLFNSQRFLI